MQNSFYVALCLIVLLSFALSALAVIFAAISGMAWLAAGCWGLNTLIGFALLVWCAVTISSPVEGLGILAMPELVFYLVGTTLGTMMALGVVIRGRFNVVFEVTAN